ncbi:MAG: nucleoside deaminase [Planctomycetes bacterium]|nr:nucleoside deaminase [Planctomycetota bacterium]
MSTTPDLSALREALRLAHENVVRHGGGPFGAVVTRGGAVVAVGQNQVTRACDPTAHAEVVAIRAACAQLGTFDLSGCEIHSSCEPCPMCLSAIHWARLERLTFAGTRHDAAAAGFDDELLYRELALPPAARALPTVQALRGEAQAAFEAWRALPDKQAY